MHWERERRETDGLAEKDGQTAREKQLDKQLERPLETDRYKHTKIHTQRYIHTEKDTQIDNTSISLFMSDLTCASSSATISRILALAP